MLSRVFAGYITLSLMKDRQWLAFMVGVLGTYLLAHAAMAGYGLYLAQGVLGLSVDGPYVGELRANYPTLAVLFAITAVLGASSVTAAVGFLRDFEWARWLWIGTSFALLVCVAFAVVSLAIAWTAYDFELGAVCVSWWFLLRLRRPAS
jgi:hypothetical protein